MSSNETLSSQTSSVSLSLSQETTNQLLSAVGLKSASGACLNEEFHIEEPEEEEGEENGEDGDNESHTGSSVFSVSRTVFVATSGQMSADPSASQMLSSAVSLTSSPPPPSTHSLTLTPTTSHTPWTSPFVGGNGISPPPLPLSHTTPPLTHLPPSQYTSHPNNIPFEGQYGFSLTLDNSLPQSSKTPNYIFSDRSQRLYLKKDSTVPLDFTIHKLVPADGCYITAMAIHKQPEMISEPLQCCVKHVDEQRRANVLFPYHFIRSPMKQCLYFGEPDQRLWISIPVSSFQRLTDSHYRGLFQFPCFTSDFKKAGQLVQIIFCLESELQGVFGRATLDVRVCASPGRDHAVQERKNSSRGGSAVEGRVRANSTTTATTTTTARRSGRKRAVSCREEVQQATFPPAKVSKVSRERVKVSIETYPELVPHVKECVKLLERVYKVPLNLPPSPTPNNHELPTLTHQDSYPGLERVLEGVGLSHHLPLFHQRGVQETFQALSLTDDELKSWGISLSDRETILHRLSSLQDRAASLPLSLSQQPLPSSQTSVSSVPGVGATQSFEVLQIQARRTNIRDH